MVHFGVTDDYVLIDFYRTLSPVAKDYSRRKELLEYHTEGWYDVQPTEQKHTWIPISADYLLCYLQIHYIQLCNSNYCGWWKG